MCHRVWVEGGGGGGCATKPQYNKVLFHAIRLSGCEGTLLAGVCFTPGRVAAVSGWLCL